MAAIKVLALDLERTLVSDAMNREPRPGLFEFLQYCVQRFERVVLFTSVNRTNALDVLKELEEQGVAPGQEARYIAIAEYDPYLVRGIDTEFQRVRSLLETRLGE